MKLQFYIYYMQVAASFSEKISSVLNFQNLP